MSGVLRLRRMEKGDLPAVAALEARCFSVPWSIGSLLYALTAEGTLCYVITEEKGGGEGETLLGYAVARCIFEDCELLNLAVEEKRRRQGVGGALLTRILSAAGEAGCRAVHLEVRESNGGARALYEKQGFRTVGRRKGYYTCSREDALCMTAILGGEEEC